MNYTICLDPNLTNFDINALSENGFAIYTDADNFTNPIAVNIPASLLFPSATGNCQFSLNNISAGATQILIVDQCDGPPPVSPGFPDVPSYNCIYTILDIPENCFGWCNECNIEFDTADFNTVGRIIVGNLQSSCGPVTDYVIGWYRNGDYSAPAVTTGFGNAFNYQYTHPLTTTTAPIISDGLYEGIIHDIKINGTQYSNQESGSGNGIPIPFESCFGTIVVAPFTCENGNFPLPYSHQISLTAEGNGVFPGPSTATFLLSSSTDYFAYNFNAFNVSDTLKIKFISGDPDATSNPDLYSQPIYLTYVETSANGTVLQSENINYYSGFHSNIYPKKTVFTGNVKLLTLTSLERTETDKLEITVTPNPNFPETSWVLQMQCLEEVNCNWCVVGDSKLINNVTIRRDLNLSSCNKKQKINFTLSSSCDWYDDLNIYGGKSVSFPQPQLSEAPISNYNFINPSPTFTPVILTTLGGGPINAPCTLVLPSNYHNITYKKYNGGSNDPNGNPTGIIEMEFFGNPTAQPIYQAFKNQIESIKTAYFPNQFQYQPDNFRYYRGWTIRMPANNGNIPCGDNNILTKTYYVHRDAEVEFTEIPSNNYWSIKMYMPYVDPVPQFQTFYTGGYSSCCGNPFNKNILPDVQNIAYTFNNSSISTNNLLDWTSNYSLRISAGLVADDYGISSIATGSGGTPSSNCYTTSSVCCQNKSRVGATNINMDVITTLPFIESLSSTPTNQQFVNLTNLKTTPCPVPQEILNNWNTSSIDGSMEITWNLFNYSLNFQNMPNDPSTFNVTSRIPYPNNEGELVAPFTVLEYTGSIGGGPGGITYIDTDYFVPGFDETNIDFTNWLGTGPAPF
jgi:hypothetical protein